MTILITGINGFVGPFLVEELLRNDPAAHVAGLAAGGENRELLADIAPGLPLRDIDLRDPDAVKHAIAEFRPSVVYHLAAASSVGASWSDPELAFQVNLLGTVHLLAALRTSAPEAVVVAPTSGEIYGPCLPGTRHREDAPLVPMSPYAVSKAAQDLVLAQEHLSGGLATIRLRPFNHTGPRRPERFALSSFARQIAEIERDLRPPRIEVGNLAAIRDFCDVRDVVKAYVNVTDRRFAGAVFNVCSGRPLRLADAIERLIGRSHRPIEIVTDTDRLRPSDVPALVGDPSAIREAAGWSPALPFDETLDDLLGWWRDQVADGAHGTAGSLQRP